MPSRESTDIKVRVHRRSVWVVDNLITSICGKAAGNTVTVDGGEPISLYGVLPVFDKASDAHRFNEGLAIKSVVREVNLVIPAEEPAKPEGAK